MSNIPSVPHYAIITFSSVTIPGDERSRTNPGHGYPEHTEETINYQAFLEKEKWETEVIRLTNSKYSSGNFRALKVTPATITTKVNVE